MWVGEIADQFSAVGNRVSAVNARVTAADATVANIDEGVAASFQEVDRRHNDLLGVNDTLAANVSLAEEMALAAAAAACGAAVGQIKLQRRGMDLDALILCTGASRAPPASSPLRDTVQEEEKFRESHQPDDEGSETKRTRHANAEASDTDRDTSIT